MSDAKGDKETKALEVSIAVFGEGKPIPREHTCDGKDVSPAIQWGPVPEGTRSLAAICDDPDAPVGIWVHWVLYDLPPDLKGLPEGVPADRVLTNGGVQGFNDFKKIGYNGPCPPRGKPHRYFFKVYALDAKLGLKPGATKKDLEKAMAGHILAQGVRMGTYQRK